ncbi:MAG TPA: hypothetical protein VND96_16645 [Candidatus Micrarchaeaceae archaeon]|nr:hypothetical protein [Candidatus Micrarchaeaceae archaeon]
MPNAATLSKLVAAFVALAAATLAVNAQAGFISTRPSLTQTGPRCATTTTGQVCDALFGGGQPMAPGGPAVSRQVTLTFKGSQSSTAAGLYFKNFSSRSNSSDPICTAADPASKFNFTVSAEGQVLYQGTLADFAASHSDPASRLALPGHSGSADRWAPGDSVTITLAVKLDRSADNQYMGCSTNADFVWFAE